jgi:potassium channel subfamily K
MVLDAGRVASYLHRTERHRLKHFRTLTNSDEGIESTDAFDLMRRLHRKARKRGDIVTLIFSICSFAIFLLIGALVFKESEGWSYFEGVYFCMLCLLTIGYGDFTPRSAAGRSFFVVWGLAAVPLMTILISNLGDTLFKRVEEGANNLADKWLHLRNKSDPSLTVNTTDNDNAESEKVFSNFDSTVDGKIQRMLTICQEMREVVKDIISGDQTTSYSYDDWQKMYALTGKEMEENPAFWISDQSPLRFKLVESRIFLEQYLDALEDMLKKAKTRSSEPSSDSTDAE